MQVKQYLDEKKISQLIDFKKLEKLTELYYGSIPDIRTYWDSCFTDLILLSSFLEQTKINYLIFDMCNNFEINHLEGYKGFEKIKLIEKNKKIIDLFKFCGNHYMWQSMNEENKKSIDPFDVLSLARLNFSSLPEKYRFKFYSDFKQEKGYDYDNKDDKRVVFKLE
jgi:hypothetical protein